MMAQPMQTNSTIYRNRPVESQFGARETTLTHGPPDRKNKNSSGDEIANVNFLRRYGTYVLQNTKKENLLRLANKTIASQVLRIQS